MDASGAKDEGAILRTAKSCGPDAPTLASSWWKRFLRRGWQQSPVTRESAKETVKTVARGMPDVSGVTVVTNACAFYTTRAAAGASGTRHSPRPPFRGEGYRHNSGAWRRGNAKLQLAVIASEAKQSILCAMDWIASLRSQWRC